MATKRAWESQETSPFAGSSRPKRSRHNFADPELPASDAASRLSISRLKKKIRDTTRVLNYSDKLPADVRIEKERALIGYQHDLDQVASKKRRKEMIKKYHMVRFFERKRATRILNRLQKRLHSTTVGTANYENLQTEIHNAEVDLNYSMYHPLDEKYTSLYPPETRRSKEEDEDLDQKKAQEESASRPTLWNVVEKCMEDGTLSALRDGKLGRAPPDATASIAAPRMGQNVTAPGKGESRKEKGKSTTDVLPEAKDDDSDGGFFEE
ncbi:18S rRNA maturation protein [Pseudocyphellaria aurata]|nr:18S rRNA maturation protein [Pseudocyphellaria aurata]